MGRGILGAAGIGISVSLAAAGAAVGAEAIQPMNMAPADTSALAAAQVEPDIRPTADFIPPEPYVEPVEQGWTWAITPRVWLLWEHDFYFQDQPGFEFFQQSNEATFVPFAGGTVSVTPGLGSPTYSLTVLYGEGSGAIRGAGSLQTFGALDPDIGVGYRGDVEMSRLDIEGIAQIPTAEGFSWTVGGRFINFKRHEEGTFFDVIFQDSQLSDEFDLEQNFYLAEGGFSLNRPINAAGSVVAFGNVLGMLGYADVVDSSAGVGVFNVPEDELQGGVFGIDTNAGLGYSLSPNLFASARYRLFYLTAPDFKFKDGGTFMHGPEINLTFTFGG